MPSYVFRAKCGLVTCFRLLVFVLRTPVGVDLANPECNMAHVGTVRTLSRSVMVAGLWLVSTAALACGSSRRLRWPKGSFRMRAWLRNERVEFCLAVMIGVIIGSSPVFIIPILESLLPGVMLWPVALLVFLACNCVALIVWWFTRHPAAY
jgi:hypothetical protein